MRKPYHILIAGVMVASFSSILIRFSDSAPIAIATYRMGFASAIMLAVLLVSNRDGGIRFPSSRDGLLIAVSGVFLGLHFATWIASLSHTSVAVSVLIVDSSPLFVVILSYAFLGERLSRHGVAGMLVLLCGGFLIVANEISANVSLYGALLALAGAISISAYIVIGRKLRGRMGTMEYVTAVYGVSFLFLLCTSLMSGTRLVGYGADELLLFLMLAAGPSCIGHTSYNYCLRHFSAAQVSASILGEPLGATILAFLVFGERPTYLIVAGGVMVVLGLSMLLGVKKVVMMANGGDYRPSEDKHAD